MSEKKSKQIRSEAKVTLDKILEIVGCETPDNYVEFEFKMRQVQKLGLNLKDMIK